MRFPGSAILVSPGALDAVRKTLRRLVEAMRLPANATVGVDFLIDAAPQTGRALSMRRRRTQASAAANSTSLTAAIGIDLDDASASPIASGSAVAAASALGASVASQLGRSSATVASAVSAALAEAAPGAADGAISLEGEPLYAVVSASDGAVIAGSPSVMAASAASPGPEPEPEPEVDPMVAIYTAAGAVAGVLLIGCLVTLGWRCGRCSGKIPVSPKSSVQPKSIAGPPRAMTSRGGAP